MSGRLGAAASGGLQALSQPDNVRRLRRVLIAALALWLVLALADLVWALVPAAPVPEQAPPVVINPVSSAGGGVDAPDVDIEQMVAWHLFGEAGAEPAPPAPVQEQVVQDSAAEREGIEKGARETKLKLVLRGAVATSDDGLGHAIIEYQRKQAVYAVEDKLPVPGRVSLAKVMPTQVVLDNGGTYELLKLHDKSALPAQVGSAPARPEPAKVAPSVDTRNDQDTARLAASYRERLYQDPQSLANVVGVAAVREGGSLVGYRVSPGQDQAQFTQLGFKAGDLVKSINGIDLTSPANAMRLYNAMRSAPEAVFEVERAGQPVTLTVSLADTTQ